MESSVLREQRGRDNFYSSHLMSQRPSVPVSRPCPQGKTQCLLVCKYNHFEADDLTIDSWELKCLDCGLRETVAFRSDDPPEPLEEGETLPEPTRCPFCGLSNLPCGKNPCDSHQTS